MRKLENALRQCRKLYQTYEKQVKIAVIALVVITALVLFGGNGEKKEIIVEQPGEPFTEEALDTGESTSIEDVEKTKNVNLVVDISGCVKTPGIYEVADGTRLHQVIDMAGGLTKEADIDVINQAELVTDGQKILVPAKTEHDDIDPAISGNAASQSIREKININQADSIALQEIPGVGPTTAEKIIQYREVNGKFQTIDDIKNVSGIGDKTFEKMKDKICV